MSIPTEDHNGTGMVPRSRGSNEFSFARKGSGCYQVLTKRGLKMEYRFLQDRLLLRETERRVRLEGMRVHIWLVTSVM